MLMFISPGNECVTNLSNVDGNCWVAIFLRNLLLLLRWKGGEQFVEFVPPLRTTGNQEIEKFEVKLN